MHTGRFLQLITRGGARGNTKSTNDKATTCGEILGGLVIEPLDRFLEGQLVKRSDTRSTFLVSTVFKKKKNEKFQAHPAHPAVSWLPRYDSSFV